MATGNIIGKVNVPISPIKYTGETTDTAVTTVDNVNKVISVDVRKDTIQEKLVDGVNIKTINDQPILGSGNIDVSVDLSDYPKREEVEADLATKQDTLVSGTNIKTINGNSVLGDGDLDVTPDLSDYSTTEETQGMIDTSVTEAAGVLSADIEAEASRAQVAEGNLSRKQTKWFDKFVDGQNIDTQFVQGEFVYCHEGTVLEGGDVPATITLSFPQTTATAIYLNSIYLRYDDKNGDEIEYSHIFARNDFTAIGQTATLDGMSWVLDNNVTDVYFGFSSNYGFQVGSGSKPAKQLSLFTNDLGGCTLKEVRIVACGAKNNTSYIYVHAANDDWLYDEGGAGESTSVKLPDNDVTGTETFTHGEGTVLGESTIITYRETFLEKDDNDELVEVDGEQKVLYVNLDEERIYRYNGTTLVEVSKVLELGSTSTTAYRGDYGQDNYNQITALRSRVNTIENNYASTSYVNDNSSMLYKHHFDVVLTGDQIGQDPSVRVVLRFNCISVTSTPYATLSDFEGDGFIASAFGNIELPTTSMQYIFEARLVYQGSILLYISDTVNHTFNSAIVVGMGSFELQDSVTPLRASASLLGSTVTPTPDPEDEPSEEPGE